MSLSLQPDKTELCLTFEGGVGDTKTEAAARPEDQRKEGMGEELACGRSADCGVPFYGTHLLLQREEGLLHGTFICKLNF